MPAEVASSDRDCSYSVRRSPVIPRQWCTAAVQVMPAVHAGCVQPEVLVLLGHRRPTSGGFGLDMAATIIRGEPAGLRPADPQPPTVRCIHHHHTTQSSPRGGCRRRPRPPPFHQRPADTAARGSRQGARPQRPSCVRACVRALRRSSAAREQSPRACHLQPGAEFSQQADRSGSEQSFYGSTSWPRRDRCVRACRHAPPPGTDRCRLSHLQQVAAG